MQDIDVVLLISRSLHIAAAMLAIGGMAFARFVLHAVVHSEIPEEKRSAFVTAIRARWARVVHICIAGLFLTGGVNFALLAIPPKVDPNPYHWIFGVKLLAALTIFFIASALSGRSQGFARMRQHGVRWLNIGLGLAVLIILLSGVLSQVRANQDGKSVTPTTTSESE